MKRPLVILYVNGILTFPGLSKNWNRRAVTATHVLTGGQVHAESLEYLVGILSRPFGQKYRAGKLARKIEYYHQAGWRIWIVAHSNGADVSLDALRLQEWMGVERLVLIAPACNADFQKLGLTEALSRGLLNTVEVWRGGRDWPLKLTRTLPARLLGFGSLGLHGPRNHEAVANHVIHVEEPTFGHGDWFSPRNFNNTMLEILGPAHQI